MKDLDLLTPTDEIEDEIAGEDLESSETTASGLPNGVSDCTGCSSLSYGSRYQNGDGMGRV